MAPPHYVSFPWREHPKSEVHALIIVEMLNPPKQFAYKCEHLLGVHKCLGPVPADAIYDADTQAYRLPSPATDTEQRKPAPEKSSLRKRGRAA
jgi:hypothetical protein